MKSQKGITLISLTIYIIALAIVMGVVAVVSNFFYSSINAGKANIDPMAEYVKFNSFFLEEVNHKNIKVLEFGTSEEEGKKVSYIAFSNGVQYTFIEENKGIYYNTFKICREIDNCEFVSKIENGKNVVEVKFKAGNVNKTMNYLISD